MKEFQTKYNVFQFALEIPKPWYVFHHELAKEEKTLHIYIEYKSGAAFSCANCGESGCKVHDIQDQDRTWRHLNFWQYRKLLYAGMPRVKCHSCGKNVTLSLTDTFRNRFPSVFFTSCYVSYGWDASCCL